MDLYGDIVENLNEDIELSDGRYVDMQMKKS